MAKKRIANVVSRHSSMVQGGGGGLPTGFHGEIESLNPVVWYQPKRGGEGTYDPVTAMRMVIVPLDDQPDDAVLPEAYLKEHDGKVVNYFKAARLGDFVPSLDNEEPVDVEATDEDETAGNFLIPTDNMWDRYERAGGTESPQLNNNTVWAEFVEKAEIAGVPDELLDSNDYQVWAGGKFRFDRVPQKDRPGLVQEPGEDGKVRKNMLLAITEVLEEEKPKRGAGAKAGAAKGAATKGKPASAAKKPTKQVEVEEEEEESDEDESTVDSLVTAALVAALKKAPKKTMDRDDLTSIAIKAVDRKQKAEALNLVTSDEYYEESEVLIYDPKKGTVQLAS